MKHWVIHSVGNTLHGTRPHTFMPCGRGTFDVCYGARRFRLQFVPFKGMCVVAWWGPGKHPTLGDRPCRQWEFPTMKKKGARTEATGASHLAAVETEVFHDMMALVEHCAVRKYDDGEPREPGWFTVKTQGAAWCVQVKDPDAAVSFTAIGDTIDKALSTAALLLSCEEAPWEPDNFLKAQKAKKK